LAKEQHSGVDAAIVSPLDASVHGLEETSKDMKNHNIGQPRVFLKVATPDEGVKSSVSVTL
jgi:hypothetical protein